MLAVISFLMKVLDFYELLIVVWVILSWIPLSGDGLISDVAGALDRIVRPYVGIFRRFMPALGGLDFSPVIAMVILEVVKRGLVGILI
ncbi:YggT family protein [uncultured Olegusella sp.]|uniref:YggT family protein n=1 Tax=uncultured Olegusella sp. TaxID=1979846 RepID=UPI0026267A4B|nr:YggT family protein [uncultured Olegusella sp.]